MHMDPTGLEGRRCFVSCVAREWAGSIALYGAALHSVSAWVSHACCSVQLLLAIRHADIRDLDRMWGKLAFRVLCWLVYLLTAF